MCVRNLKQVIGSSRLRDVPVLAKRAAGIPYLSREDFLPKITTDEAERLRGLALRARGDAPAPIIVFGVMPRSGTNFVRDLLVEHPDVCADPGRLYEFPLLHAGGAARAFMDEFIAMFPRNAEVLGRWDALAMLSGVWLRELQLEAGEKRILLKSPHVHYLNLAPLIFPDAKIVLCLRDGRDVTESSLRTFSRWSPARKTFGQLAHEWALGTDAILSFEEGGANAHPDIKVVHYEKLVSDADEEVHRILTHVGLEPERYPFEKLETMPVRGSSRSNANDTERWQPQEKDRNFKPIGRWNSWSKSRRARFDRIAGQTLQGAGYERST